MNKQKRSEQAARWHMLWRDEARLDELQRKALWHRLYCALLMCLFRCWLLSKENAAAYLDIAAIHRHIERMNLPERTQAVSATIVPFMHEARVRGRVVMSQPTTRPVEPRATGPADQQARRLLTRRQMVAGLTMVVVGAGAVVPVRRFGVLDVLATGHVQLVALRDGVMHAARHTLFRVYPSQQAHTVHLLAGPVAVHLWKGKGAPTLVTTPLAEIIVAAAKFFAFATESRLEIAVAEGSVRVILTAFGLADVTLHAGEQLTLQRDAEPAQRITNVDAHRKLSWTRGRLSFNGETLAEAAATFNRFNDVQIVPSPDVLGLRVATQRCALSEPERFVERFVAAQKLAARTEGKVIRIFKRDEAPMPR